MPDSPSQQDDGTRASGGSRRSAASGDPLQYQRRTRRSSLQHPDTIEEISKQLSRKITDLQDETRIQRAVLNELASINATLLARCRVLEKENGELWNEIFRMKGPIFPNEMTDIFIDFLHKDRGSLANCALVCKDWLAASRYHLFGSLTFNNSSSKRQTDLAELIVHPLCTFKFSVRRITLERVERHGDDNTWLSTSIPHLPEFHSVTTLRLINLTPQLVQCSSFTQIWTQKRFLQGITKVDIQKSGIPLNAQDLLEKFPNMTSINYVASAILIFSPAGHVPLHHPFADFLSTSLPEQWRKISLTFPRSVWGVGMKRWFRLLRRTPKTADLALYEVREADIPALSDCFRLLGSALSSLTVGFTEERSQSLFSSMNILSLNSNLETIFLFGSLFYDLNRKGYLESLRNVPGLLTSIPKTHLCRIVLAFVFGDFSTMLAGGAVLGSSEQEKLCSEMDDLLTPGSSSSRFPHLKEVAFKLCPPGSAFSVTEETMGEVKNILADHFPNLHASELLGLESDIE